MAMEQTDLRDKVVVITGAARSMGRAYAEGFASVGARVVATDVSWDKTGDLRERIEAGGNGLALDMDVTDDGQIEEAYEATMARFGTVDVVINNAALLNMVMFPPAGRPTTLETKPENWTRMLDVNVVGPLRVMRAFCQPMLENQRGSVINVVSSGILAFSHGGGYQALRPWTKEMPYMATKAALANMSFYMADEVKQHNIAVNVVFPGHTRASWFDDAVRARVARGMPPGLRPVVPGHMVPLVMFLAAQDGSGVTGKMFDAMVWNVEHGLGGHETWVDMGLPADLEEAFAKAGAAVASGVSAPSPMRP